jgi:formylglycine-generating enzyme required for sulfatase activity
MGSPPEESDRNPDEQIHILQVTSPFAVGESEISLGYYRQFVEATGYRPTAGSGSPCLRPDKDWQQLVEDWSLSWESPGYEVTDRYPVTCVSWIDARAYARWLSTRTGHRYRLPTELEWEYAARAGTSSSRFWGDDSQAGCRYANTADCDDKYTYAAPVGTFPPNAFGLRDMLGNLAEWTCSQYGKAYRGAETECSDETGAGPRVFRGGSWLDAPRLVRSAARDGAPPKLRLNTVGFRLVRTLDSASEGKEPGTSQVAKKP